MSSKKYITAFNDLAKTQKRIETEGLDTKFWVEINTDIRCSMPKVLASIRRAFKLAGLNGTNIRRRCLNATTIASETLIESKVKHSVTMGNLSIDSRPYYNVTKEIVEQELASGYSTEECQVHSWITLENGTIIDFTVLSEIAHTKNKKAPNLQKEIYLSNHLKYRKHRISHIPYMLGPEFICKTCTPYDEMSEQTMTMWMVRTHDLLSD